MKYDDFFTTIDNNNPVVKIAIHGDAGSGKSYTAALIAAGLYKHFNMSGPIVIFDTEESAKFLGPLFQGQDIETLVKRSRALTDLCSVLDYCKAGNAPVVLIDSITHVWEGFVEAYKAEKRRKYIQFDDWGILKPEWKRRFSDAVVMAPFHVIFTGRQGHTYQYEVNEDTGKRELIQTGVKMQVERETPYEPDLLIMMERVEELMGRDKKITRIATVIKDRADLIDGKTFEDPTFENFLPTIQFMTSGTPKDHPATGDDRAIFAGDNGHTEHQNRKIWLERCRELFNAHTDNRTKNGKEKRYEALMLAFGDTSETAIAKLDANALRTAYERLQVHFGIKPPPSADISEEPPDRDELEKQIRNIEAVQMGLTGQELLEARDRYLKGFRDLSHRSVTIDDLIEYRDKLYDLQKKAKEAEAEQPGTSDDTASAEAAEQGTSADSGQLDLSGHRLPMSSSDMAAQD